MGRSDNSTSGLNFSQIADGVAEMREAFQAMVAGLIQDGFTDEQARDIIAGIWRQAGKPDQKE